MAKRIRARRGTTAAWTTANTILGNGELGFDTDLGQLKIGDGITAWVDLDFVTVDFPAQSYDLQFAASDEATVLTTGTSVVRFRAPRAMIVTGVRASLGTLGTSDVQLSVKVNTVAILDANLVIVAGSKTSYGDEDPPAVLHSAIAEDAEITVDIVAAGVTAAGLKITILGHL